MLWFIMKCIDNASIDNYETWTGFNAMVTKARSITNVNALPLYPSPPTDFSHLYQALKICQIIATDVVPSRKTIISTKDLQDLQQKQFSYKEEMKWLITLFSTLGGFTLSLLFSMP